MVLLNIFCAAQDTANSKGKLVSEDAHWTNITTDRWDSSYVKIDNFNIKGDTTVNAHEYLKVYLNNELYAGLREDEDHKVYAHFFLLDTQQYKQEYLLYDFSWQLGDTLSYEPVWADTLMHAYVIDSLDSIKLDDQSYYECIPLGGDITLIKNIGYTEGIFFHMFATYPGGKVTTLFSFYSGQQLVYSRQLCCPYVHKNNMRILPKHPTSADSIYLSTHVVTDYGGRCLGYQVSETGTQINVEACYWKDLQRPWKEYVDTISLGRKKPGDYKGKFSAYLSSNPDSCTREDTSTFTLDFTVSPASKIQPAEKQYGISCYPNPSTGKITFRIEQDPKSLKLLQIYSSNGRLLYSTAINNRKQIIVNGLPAGSYFYKITGENDLIYHSDQLVIIK